jgi:hypothetical protein
LSYWTISPVDEEPPHREVRVVPMQGANAGASVQGLHAMEAAAGNTVGRGKDRFKIRDLFADERCSRPILDFLRTTEVGRKAGPSDEEQAGEGEEGPSTGTDSGSDFFSLPLSLSCGMARRGQAECRVPYGLTDAGADGEQDRTVYNLAMIQ